MEVFGHNLARLLSRNVDAMAGGDCDGTRIGRGAMVPASRAGGIDEIGVFGATRRHDGAEHTFGQRRAADVAEADEKYACVGLCDH
jgi:hypothetical protein